MCRFELRIEEADFETFGGGGGYMVVVVATNYSVSSRQGSRLLGLSPSLAYPCLTLA